MKQLITPLVLSMTLLATTSFAESPKYADREAMRAQHMQEMVDSLELDDARKAEVMAEMESFQSKRTALQQENRTEMRSLMDEHRAKMDELLTDEELATLRQDFKGKRPGKRGGPCPMDPPETPDMEEAE